jgi:predicted nucleic acid-binding protein
VICVVDASVAVKWFVRGDGAAREDHVDVALNLLQASAEGQARFVQPPHFLAEVAAVLGRLAPASAARDLARLSDLDIAWTTPAQAVPRALALTMELGHHLFDTLYHAVALEAPDPTVLVTADRRYFDKARHLGRITWLPDWSPDQPVGSLPALAQ